MTMIDEQLHRWSSYPFHVDPPWLWHVHLLWGNKLAWLYLPRLTLSIGILLFGWTLHRVLREYTPIISAVRYSNGDL